MQAETLALIRQGDAKKGDVLGTARLAGIMASKKTHDLIPLCHPLLISKVKVDCTLDESLPGVRVTAEVKVSGPDGRRNGSAHRRLRRLPDDLRHGESGGSRHADREHSAALQKRRALRALSEAMSLISIDTALQGVLNGIAGPVEAERIALSAAAGRVLAEDLDSLARPATLRGLRHGWICGAQHRCGPNARLPAGRRRQRGGSAISGRDRNPAKPCASLPARRCRTARIRSSFRRIRSAVTTSC